MVRNHLLHSLSGSQELRMRASRSISANTACSAFSDCASDVAATLISSDVPSTFSYWKTYRWPRAEAAEFSARHGASSRIAKMMNVDFIADTLNGQYPPFRTFAPESLHRQTLPDETVLWKAKTAIGNQAGIQCRAIRSS